ncbi:hypothetical protein FAES_3999 [Fibrella aestuarina BUZ 2]|uniref:Outer membrane protein beta-barrel domain-containing protein n=1 Tax=Fibrella aestuarina BUZ 2 TaxID=1166018 RepID=I0KCZ7_9BACT|nr:porin family protein [Fibrella aestuarina]CCH02000.1 hypothetical protein FAES_3999 [Fibrella aestuarina BUZ 2]
MTSFRYCLSALLLASLSTSFAQIRWGLRAGVSSSTAATELVPVSTYTPLPGLQAGVVVDIPLSEILSIQPVLLFASKGFERSSFFEDNVNPLDQPYGTAALRIETVKPYYLKIPVLILVKAPLTQEVKLYMGLGPYVGTLIGGTVLYDYKSVYSKGPLSPSRNSFYARSDAGLTGATGVELMDRFQLGIAYDYGLMNVTSDPLRYSLRNRTVSLSLSVFL